MEVKKLEKDLEKKYKKYLKDNNLKLTIFTFADFFKENFWGIKFDEEFSAYYKLREVIAEKHLNNISKKMKREIYGN